MAMNRVQFQRGLSMAEFMDRYGTEDKCETALVASGWPTRFTCPGCGGPARTSFRREGRLYWQCANCGHQCSLTSGTIFSASKLARTRWFLAMHLLTQAKNRAEGMEGKPSGSRSWSDSDVHEHEARQNGCQGEARAGLAAR